MSELREYTIDWVDISPFMLEEAKKILEETKIKKIMPAINFIESDIIDYLNSSEDDSLDLIIMKYTIDYMENIELFFELIKNKIKK
jgi:ubiquinone/menaquinone biosynthesis C-methylase UbiE